MERYSDSKALVVLQAYQKIDETEEQLIRMDEDLIELTIKVLKSCEGIGELREVGWRIIHIGILRPVIHDYVIGLKFDPDVFFEPGYTVAELHERYGYVGNPHTRIPYAEYLKTDHWKEKRSDALAWAENRCQLCYKTGRLQVHHRTYERLWNERTSDLVALCPSCHEKFHDVMEASYD